MKTMHFNFNITEENIFVHSIILQIISHNTKIFCRHWEKLWGLQRVPSKKGQKQYAMPFLMKVISFSVLFSSIHPVVQVPLTDTFIFISAVHKQGYVSAQEVQRVKF